MQAVCLTLMTPRGMLRRCCRYCAHRLGVIGTRVQGCTGGFSEGSEVGGWGVAGVCQVKRILPTADKMLKTCGAPVSKFFAMNSRVSARTPAPCVFVHAHVEPSLEISVCAQDSCWSHTVPVQKKKKKRRKVDKYKISVLHSHRHIKLLLNTLGKYAACLTNISKIQLQLATL